MWNTTLHPWQHPHTSQSLGFTYRGNLSCCSKEWNAPLNTSLLITFRLEWTVSTWKPHNRYKKSALQHPTLIIITHIFPDFPDEPLEHMHSVDRRWQEKSVLFLAAAPIPDHCTVFSGRTFFYFPWPTLSWNCGLYNNALKRSICSHRLWCIS